MSDHASTPVPSTEELNRIAQSVGLLHRAVQGLNGDAWERTFAAAVARQVAGASDRDLTEDERRKVLGRVRGSLNRLIDGLGLWPDRYPPHPEVIELSDRTPRRQVWETALRNRAGDGLFVELPKPLQEHIVTAAVERESEALDRALKDYYSDVIEGLPTWQWDAERLAAIHEDGYLEPANEPNLDDLLEEARAECELHLGYTQVGALIDWIDQQLQTLADHGWTVDHVQNYEQADLTWHLDPGKKQLYLHTHRHAHLKQAQRRFTAEEAAVYPMLARSLAKAIAATAPSPAQTAFPAQAAAASSDDTAVAKEPDPTVAPDPAEPQR